MAGTRSMCSFAVRNLFRLHSSSPLLWHNSVNMRNGIRQVLSTATTTGQPNPAEKPPPTSDEVHSSDSNKEPNDVSPSEKVLQEENKKLLEQVKEIDDKYKRALAENENIRFRMRRQVDDAKQFGIQSFCKDLLEVADVLSKATETVPKEEVSNENPHLQNLFQGLQMTEAQLQTVFRRHGLTQINPIGEKFDPNIHEALFEHVDSSKEPGTVALVTKIGYKLHDRTIRPALVGVVKASS